jgi:hypothetical protein
VISVLSANSYADIDGQRMGDDNFVWWHVSSGGWLRQDTVSEPGTASSLPQM